MDMMSLHPIVKANLDIPPQQTKTVTELYMWDTGELAGERGTVSATDAAASVSLGVLGLMYWRKVVLYQHPNGVLQSCDRSRRGCLYAELSCGQRS